MSVKINKDLAKFIKDVCKDEGLDRTKYINKLLWDGIKVDFKEGMEKKAEAQEEKAYLMRQEFDKHDFSKGIW